MDNLNVDLDMFEPKVETVEDFARLISVSLKASENSLITLARIYTENLEIGTLEQSPSSLSFALHKIWEISAATFSFYAAIGAARDHISKFVARKCDLSTRIDSYASLLRFANWESLHDEPLVISMLDTGLLSLGSNGEWQRDTPLRSIFDRRNAFVHRTTFPRGLLDGFATLNHLTSDKSLKSLNVPLKLNDQEQPDALALFHSDFLRIDDCFAAIAKSSGYDTSIVTLTAKDVKPVGEGGE